MTNTLCIRKVFAKSLFTSALLLAATLVRSENLERVRFQVISPDSPDASTIALFGAQSVPSGTASGQMTMSPFPFDKRATQREIDSHLMGIETITRQQGPYAPALSEPLLALGRLYQNEQKHDKAVELLARAQHLNRVNHGLDSPEQFPAVEMAIESYLAMHQYQEAAEQQQALVQMYRQRYGAESRELVGELSTLGDMYFDAFERWRHDVPGGSALLPESSPEMGPIDPTKMQPVDIAFACLLKAQQSYVKSITILLKQGAFRDPELAKLEHDVITTLFLQANRRGLDADHRFFVGEEENLHTRGQLHSPWEDEKTKYYRTGEDSYVRLLNYQLQDPAIPAETIAETMMQLGDWHRLFGRLRQSEKTYEEAAHFLRANVSDEAVVARILNPAVPVQLPSFLPAPYSVEDGDFAGVSHAEGGYVDVTFTLDRNGNARHFEVQSSSSNATSAIETRIFHVLRNAPFRPQFDAESISEPRPVTVRYQFAQY